LPQTIGPKGWPKGKIDPKSALILPFLSLYRKYSRQTLPFLQREALLGFSPSSWSSKLKHVSLRVSCSYPYTLFASWTCVFPLGITIVIYPCSTVFIFNSLNCLRNCCACNIPSRYYWLKINKTIKYIKSSHLWITSFPKTREI